MKKTLTRVSPLRFGIVSAALYAFFSILFVPFMVISVIVGSNSGSTLAGIAGAIFMGLLYPVIGFIGGVVVAALYNLIVPFTGGIEVEVE